MTKAQLKLYRLEFEKTAITIEELCEKNNITPEDLPGHSKWNKLFNNSGAEDTKADPEIQTDSDDNHIASEDLPKPVLDLEPEVVKPVEDLEVYEVVPIPDEEDIPEPTEATTVPAELLPDAPPEGTTITEREDTNNIQEQIRTFKDKTIEHALKFITLDANTSEIKELKDMVAVVDTIEKSLEKNKGPESGVTVQVLVQNVISGYQDDC